MREAESSLGGEDRRPRPARVQSEEDERGPNESTGDDDRIDLAEEDGDYEAYRIKARATGNQGRRVALGHPDAPARPRRGSLQAVDLPRPHARLQPRRHRRRTGSTR